MGKGLYVHNRRSAVSWKLPEAVTEFQAREAPAVVFYQDQCEGWNGVEQGPGLEPVTGGCVWSGSVYMTYAEEQIHRGRRHGVLVRLGEGGPRE